MKKQASKKIASDPSDCFKQAIILHKQGKVDGARAVCDGILARWPRHSDSWNLLAHIHHHRGAILEARRCLEKALEVGPTDLEALSRLGQVHMDTRSFDDALKAYESILGIKPDHLEALNNRGTALMALQRPSEALTSFDMAIHVAPNIPELRFNRGNALGDLGRLADALLAYSAALDLRPQYAQALQNRGNVLRDLMRPAEALEDYDRSLAVDPNCADVHNNKGVVATTLGRFEVATPAFESAIRLRPRHAIAYFNLTVCKTFKPDDRLIDAMDDLLKSASPLEAGEYTYLHFALGKAFSDVGDHHNSFRHLIAGNEIKRRQITYDEAETYEILATMRESFTHERMHAQFGLGDVSFSPIFIIGMPRSGSSMIEQILASCPGVFACGESDDLISALSDVAGEDRSFTAVSQLSIEQISEIGSIYIDRIGRSAPTASRTVDKTLSNFRFLGLIHLALPNARFIHTRRNPMDTCLSCFSNLFTEANQPFTYDLAELGRYYRGYEAMMAYWRSALPPGIMLDLSYEDTVADLDGQMRRVFDHCEMQWDPVCLQFDKLERPVYTASKFQVRQPLYNSSIGRWHRYEPFLRPLLETLGIKPDDER